MIIHNEVNDVPMKSVETVTLPSKREIKKTASKKPSKNFSVSQENSEEEYICATCGAHFKSEFDREDHQILVHGPV
jgi:hypothetical protein